MRAGVAIALMMCAGACGKGGSGAAGTGTGTATGVASGSGTGTGTGSAIDAQPMMDASNDPVDTTGAAADWWKKGCPNAGQLDGAPPPAGKHVWCKRADGANEGPEAFWDDKGHPLTIRSYKDGRMQGLATTFYPDGKKHREGSYRAGNMHGTWTTWWPDGKVYLVEKYVDGRADGEQVATAADGTVLARWSLKMGTGTMNYWDEAGHKTNETAYVDGRAHGLSTSYWANGKVQTKMRFVDGEPDGPTQDFWDSGQPRAEGTYARGTQVGDWKQFDEHGAQTVLTRRDASGDEQFEVFYQGGALLAPLPAASACDSKAGLQQVAFGGVRTRGNTPECLERIRHFPGVAVSGNFAYDAGCMNASWIVDCKKVATPPDSAALLARAGWAKAAGPLRELLALAYVREVDMMWSGSFDQEPKATAAADESVVVEGWTRPPSGMRPDPTITLVQWTFAKDGAVSQKAIKTGTHAP